MEKTSKNLDVILWTIFQYSNIIKICGFDLETGEFRISSAITTKIMQQIEKHVKTRDPNVNWHDVSYFADVSFFDGDFL